MRSARRSILGSLLGGLLATGLLVVTIAAFPYEGIRLRQQPAFYRRLFLPQSAAFSDLTLAAIIRG
jgi:hypothetical protein